MIWLMAMFLLMKDTIKMHMVAVMVTESVTLVDSGLNNRLACSSRINYLYYSKSSMPGFVMAVLLF